MRSKMCVWILLSIIFLPLHAQNVGIGTTTPHPSAQLEIKANNQGFLIPRLTTTQRNTISNPAHSLLIFNIDNFCIEVYDSVSGQWLAVSCPISCPACDTTQCLTPSIDSISGPDTICSGDTVQYILHGSGGNAFIWNIPANWVMISQGQLATFIADSSGTVYGHLCNQCGCSSDSIIVTTQTPPASVSLSGPDSVCIIDTIVILASGGTFYNWYVPSGWTIIYQGDSLIALSSDTGIYYVGVEACNNCGCSPKDSLQIVVLDTALGTVTIAGPTFACAGDTIVFKAPNQNATVWNWQFPSSWQLITQSGDSIVLVPDTVDGNINVTMCISGNCNLCKSDSLAISTIACRTFCIAIGSDSTDVGQTIVETADKGFVIGGYTYSFSTGASDIYVIKIDSVGNIQWTKSFGGLQDEEGTSIIQTKDGSFVITGFSSSFNSLLNADIFMAKLSNTGNILWSKTMGSILNSESSYSIIETYDSGFVIAGVTASFSPSADMYIIKTDSTGNALWTKVIGGTGIDYARSILQAKDSGFVIVGYTNSFGAGDDDIYVVKLDKTGNILWTRTFGGTSRDRANQIISTYDGGFAIIGFSLSYGTGNYTALIIKIDSSGNLIWAKYIEFALGIVGNSITQLPDSTLVIAGTVNISPNNQDIYVAKLDQHGNLIWTRIIGGISIDQAFSIYRTTDNRLIIVGSTESYGRGKADVYIIKLDQAGNLQSCIGGCQISSGGTIQAVTPSVSSGGSSNSGGSIKSVTPTVSSGGTLTNICP